jgi:hypothetical protein
MLDMYRVEAKEYDSATNYLTVSHDVMLMSDELEISQYISCFGQYISRFGQYISRFGQYISRFGQYISRFGQYVSRFGQYISRFMETDIHIRFTSL